MIRYALACGGGHEYEAWFRDSSDFDEQSRRGLVQCPACGAKDVRKQVMAPAVATSRRKEARAQTAAGMAAAARRHIAENFDNVGDRFPEIARAIHDGIEPVRGVYGQATPDEASALRDEGVPVSPLPYILTPEFDKKLN